MCGQEQVGVERQQVGNWSDQAQLYLGEIGHHDEWCTSCQGHGLPKLPASGRQGFWHTVNHKLRPRVLFDELSVSAPLDNSRQTNLVRVVIVASLHEIAQSFAVPVASAQESGRRRRILSQTAHEGAENNTAKHQPYRHLTTSSPLQKRVIP